MADFVDRCRAEAGTTLAELLVVILLLSFVGALTTAGIVRGFNAQRDATNVASTLDGMRLATQRVRDFVRGADEVCASSTAEQLVLWTDDDDDGVVDPPELDIFEVDTTVSPEVFVRRVPDTGETQIIRDDILNDAVFSYTAAGAVVAPADQPASLSCKNGVAVTDGPTRVRSVTVEFLVEHPEPGQPNLETSTAVRIRNADLIAVPNTSPVAEFTFECPDFSQTCSFDASTSSDPDGSVVSYFWDFGDGTGDTGVTTSHSYSLGDTDYDVTLLVVDDEGASDVVTYTVRPGLLSGNARPIADFSYTCDGRICFFDASPSTDDGTIVSYSWDFGDGTGSTEKAPVKNFPDDGTYAVTLTVRDDFGELSDPEIKSVVASQFAMIITDLSANVTEKTNNYDVTFTIQLGVTASGTPGDGITVSVEVSGGKSGTNSCSTDAAGRCTITINAVKNTSLLKLEVTNLTDDTARFTHDPNQDVVDAIVTDKNNNVTKYKDGEVVP